MWLFKKKKEEQKESSLYVKAPINGILKEDTAYAKNFMGNGILILCPFKGVVKSPVNGIITKIIKDGFILKTEDNLSILIKFKLDNFKIEELKFKFIEGDKVKELDDVFEYDFDYLNEKIDSIQLSLSILDKKEALKVNIEYEKDIKTGDKLITVEK